MLTMHKVARFSVPVTYSRSTVEPEQKVAQASQDLYEKFRYPVKVGLSKPFGEKNLNFEIPYTDDISRVYQEMLQNPSYYLSRLQLSLLTDKQNVQAINRRLSSTRSYAHSL
jgi:hypothetical protein